MGEDSKAASWGHRLRIEGTPGKYRVSLDGHDLRYATNVELAVGANGQPAAATITVLAGEITVDVEGDIVIASLPINTAKERSPA